MFHRDVFMSVLGVFRSAPSACALAFGVPKFPRSCIFEGSIRIYRAATPLSPAAVETKSRSFQTLQERTTCLWAAATAATTPQVEETSQAETADSVKEFEEELDAISAEGNDEDGPLEKLSPPRRLSLLESNVKILERDCKVAQLFLDAAISRKDVLYLGLDISTQSTGYAVLRPCTAAVVTRMETSCGDILYPSGGSDADKLALLRDTGEAKLVEWGFISGTGSDGKKGDEVDVGVIVEEKLMELATRCGTSIDHQAPSEPSSPPSPLSTEPSEQEGGGKGLGAEGATVEEGGTKVGAKGQVWVVGVEDFMRRFLPGRSNSKSIFALAQLNGIVKYACHKHLGTKANSYHPSTPRSFYGLTKNKPEGKDMKQIVHDFALSQENGALDARYEWPMSPDGSKADASFDITDAYLIARYSWHRDVFRDVAGNTAARDRCCTRT
ncbi:unnamed protein product [Scytosiphon promiscuus]